MISVVVPACGQVALTRRCVASIRQWTAGAWELVLVDNGSTPDEARALADLCADVGGVYVRFREMIGYPRAINEGVRLALGEWICLMNNDAAFTGPWISLMPPLPLARAAVISPIIDVIGQPCQRLGDADAPGRLAQVGMLFFVCVTMRRETFDAVGGLDEGYGLGNGEDVAFCETVKNLGGRLLVEPGVFVTHQGSVTFLERLGEQGYQDLLIRNSERRGRDGEQS